MTGILRSTVIVGLILLVFAIFFFHADPATLTLLDVIVGFLALLSPVIISRLRKARKTSPPSRAEITEILDPLALRIESAWRSENERRDLGSRNPLEIHWSEMASFETQELLWPSPLPANATTSKELIERLSTNRPRRLVVLGGPGAGKTTFAVQFLLRVCSGRAKGDPVPIFLSLSSWDPGRTSLHKWIKQELLRSHPWLVHEQAFTDPDSFRHLMTRVILVLDGLDELAESRQIRALEILDRELGLETSIILTCRSETYKRLALQSRILSLAPVVSAMPVTPKEAMKYMRGRVPRHQDDTLEPFFKFIEEYPDSIFATALSSPLTIWLAERVLIRGERYLPTLFVSGRFASAVDVRMFLLREFVSQAFHGSSWSQERSNAWLRSLAKQLTKAHTVNIAWWRLRDLVPPAGIFTIFSVGGAIFFGIAGFARYDQGAAFAAAGATAAALASGFRPRPESRYQDLRGFDIVRSCLRLVGRASLLFLILLVVSDALIGVTLGGLAGAALIATLQYAWVPVGISDQDDSPSVVLRRHLNMFFRNVIGGAGGGASMGILIGIVASSRIGFLEGLLTGLIGGLAVGLLRANAWLGYRIAHFWFAAHRAYPWRFMTFLKEAHKRDVLRQSGPVYQFRHLDLQLCLAGDDRPPHQLPTPLGVEAGPVP